MIVRFGLEALPEVLAELGVKRPLLVAGPRFGGLELPVELGERRFRGARPHAEEGGVRGAVEAARAHGADALLPVGGGSVIDTAKAASAETGLPVVSVPTTYSGAEWTTGVGVRDPGRREKRQGGGARTAAAVYEPRLTLELPRTETCGSALNASAHCAEALYAQGRDEQTEHEAVAGAALIAARLPAVVEAPRGLEARTDLLQGAMHAGAAMRAGVGLGHAMAQALGGRFGLAHGAMNAVCLPAALRFNAEVAAAEIRRFAEAMGAADAVARAGELASLGGFGRLRDFGIPAGELPGVAAAAAARSGARANPRPAPPGAILRVLRELWWTIIRFAYSLN